MKELRIKRMRPGAALPLRGTSRSAGCDLCACIDEPLLLPAGGRVSVPTGIAVEPVCAPEEHVGGFVFGRSGLGIRHGIVPSNAVGVIDEDYRGEILVGLSNLSDTDYRIQPGERIAQLVFLPVLLPEIVECEALSDTPRGEGGFGSTGRM